MRVCEPHDTLACTPARSIGWPNTATPFTPDSRLHDRGITFCRDLH